MVEPEEVRGDDIEFAPAGPPSVHKMDMILVDGEPFYPESRLRDLDLQLDAIRSAVDKAYKEIPEFFLPEEVERAIRGTESRFCITCGKTPVSEEGRTCLPCIKERFPDNVK